MGGPATGPWHQYLRTRSSLARQPSTAHEGEVRRNASTPRRSNSASASKTSDSSSPHEGRMELRRVYHLPNAKKTIRCRSRELEKCRASGGSAPATATRGSGSAHLEVPHPKPGNDWLAPGSRPATRLFEHVVETWICQRTCLDCARLRACAWPLPRRRASHHWARSFHSISCALVWSHSSDCNCRAPGPTSSECFSSHQRGNLRAKTHVARQQGRRKPRQMLENWRRRHFQNFASGEQGPMQAERINGRAETDARGSHCKRGT